MEGIKWEGRGKEGMGRERRGKRLPHECGLATGLYYVGLWGGHVPLLSSWVCPCLVVYHKKIQSKGVQK